jgi:UBX domain
VRQSEARRLRTEQDAEYQRALQADRERQRRTQEEAEERVHEQETRVREAQRQAEEDAARGVHQAEEQRARLARLGVEPTQQSAEAASTQLVELVVRLPDSSRLRRHFLASDPLQRVYDFVDTHQVCFAPGSYSLFSPHPRHRYADRTRVLSDTPLPPKALLLLQPE